MKRIVLAIAIVSMTMVACKNGKKGAVEAKKAVKVKEIVESDEIIESKLDLETSVIDWIGSKPTESHNGTLKFVSGKFITNDNKLVGGEFLIDMNSIKNLDEDSEEMQKKLESHLKGGDFFDVSTYPTSKFEITSVKELEQNIEVTGNLTVKDKTKSITFPANFKVTETGFMFESDLFKINRIDFGVTYKSKTINAALKDKFIKDLMEMKVKLSAKK